MKQLAVGELFCGPGGLGFGFTQSARKSGIHYTHAWINDICADSCKTYAANMPIDEGNIHVKNVQELDFNRLKAIDGLLFGFPCNDFSNVGEKKGLAGKYGNLYQYGVECLKIKQPLWFIAENVSGLKGANAGEAFKKILNELRSAGYRVFVHQFKFEEYGVPQARHRIIIIGFREDTDFIFTPPAPSLQRVTARTALEEPPIPINAPNHEKTKQSAVVVERLSYIAPGENAWNAALPEHLKLNVKSARLSTIYKRLHPDKPAYTVTGSGGGGTHIYHWQENRALTNRERARLQTFPDHFIFHGSKESVRKQIGMAVPVKGAEIIAEALFKTLFNVSSAPHKNREIPYTLSNQLDLFDMAI